MLAIRSLLTPCGCETPEAFLRSMQVKNSFNNSGPTTVAQVNWFWRYRSRCGVWRCSGGSPHELSKAEIALYLPLFPDPDPEPVSDL